jgi:hypothetical protein
MNRKLSQVPIPRVGREVTKVTDARARAKGKWQSKFLQVLAETPSVKAACVAAGVSRMTAYRYRTEDAEFAEQWHDAIRQSVDDLEAVAFKLAAEGDSSLIQFILKSHRPEIYRDTQRHEVGLLGGVVLLPPKEKGDE